MTTKLYALSVGGRCIGIYKRSCNHVCCGHIYWCMAWNQTHPSMADAKKTKVNFKTAKRGSIKVMDFDEHALYDVFCSDEHHIRSFHGIDMSYAIEKLYGGETASVDRVNHAVVIDCAYCYACKDLAKERTWIARNYRTTNGGTRVTVHNVGFLFNNKRVTCSFRGRVVAQDGSTTRIQLQPRPDVPFRNVKQLPEEPVMYNPLFRSSNGLFCVEMHGADHYDRTLVRGAKCNPKRCPANCINHTLYAME